jgi:hypothetical protein
MQDVNSKIQNYATQVKAGNFPGSEDYTCQVSGTPPRAALTASPSGSGTNDACIFLGSAIQAVVGDSNLYVYTTLGNRDKYNGGIDSGLPATKVEEANPEPAMANGNFVLTDNYKVPFGAVLLSSKVTGQAGEYDLVGFYTNLEKNTSVSGNTALALRGYPFTSDVSNPSLGVQGCIEELPSPAPCSSASYINQWNLCFRDSVNQRRASIAVNSGSSGITTQLSFADCN